MRTADKFTLSRIIFAPVIFIVYYSPAFFAGVDTASGGVFSRASIIVVLALTAFAEFTDFLDGFYARRHNSVSGFGKIFDPFADVILHLTLFVCCAFSGYLPVFILLLILYREFSMLFIRLLAVQKGVAIGARKGGKAKTVLYVISVFCALAVETATRFGLEKMLLDRLHTALIAIFLLCLFAAYISFVDYLLYFKKLFKTGA